MVNDKEKIDQERVESINKVKGAFFNSGQYQIIFGTGTVNKVYEEVSGLDIESMSASEQKKKRLKAVLLSKGRSGNSGMYLCQSFQSLLQQGSLWDCADW